MQRATLVLEVDGDREVDEVARVVGCLTGVRVVETHYEDLVSREECCDECEEACGNAPGPDHRQSCSAFMSAPSEQLLRDVEAVRGKDFADRLRRDIAARTRR